MTLNRYLKEPRDIIFLLNFRGERLCPTKHQLAVPTPPASFSSSINPNHGGSLSGDSNLKKKDGVSGVVNRFLHSLIIRCTMGPGRNIAILLRKCHRVWRNGGFSLCRKVRGSGVRLCVGSGKRVPDRHSCVGDAEGQETVRSKVWFDPVANGLTPMCQVLSHAQKIVQRFVEQYPNCYPPIVINITDGDSTDGNPESSADNSSSPAPPTAMFSCSMFTCLRATKKRLSSRVARGFFAIRMRACCSECRALFR